MKWLSVCWWASRAAPAYLARYLSPHLACVCGCGTSQLQTPYLDASQAHPRLGPISRISLRLFQLSNPSIRLQNRPHLHCSPAVIESPASQLFHRPRRPVLEPFLRVDAPRSKAKVIGPTAPGHGQPRPTHALQQFWSQGKASRSSRCLLVPTLHVLGAPRYVFGVCGNVTWCAPCPVSLSAESSIVSGRGMRARACVGVDGARLWMGDGDFECGWCAEDLGPPSVLHVVARDLKPPPPAKARQRTAF